MSNHARLSPSSRHRWQLCPGSVRECAKYPNIKTKSSIDGTHSHTLLEQCLLLKKNACEFVGEKLTDHEGDFVVDDDRAQRVQVALDYIDSKRSVFEVDSKVFSEIRVEIKDRPDLGGTIDVQIHQHTGEVEIIDYKDGFTPVEVIGNPQLEQYALGVIDKCHLEQNVIVTTIIQPKLTIRGLPAIRLTSNTVEYYEEIVRPKLLKEAAATDDPNAPLVPGESQCKHCPAKGGCSALAEKAMKDIGVHFQPIAQQVDVVSQVVDAVKTSPTTMSNEQLVSILEAAPLVRQMLEAAEEEAQNRANRGEFILGFKLVNGKGARSWAYGEKVMEEKLVKMGIPKTALYVTKLVSPAQAEKITWEKRDGTKMTLSKKQLERMEAEYVVKVTGKPTLVPESDPRPSIGVNVARLFTPVSQLPDWLKT